MELGGKVAVITGTASGSGKAAGLLFAREGAFVIGLDIDESGGLATAEEIAAEGGRSVFFKADLVTEAGVRSAAALCLAQAPTIDILFNNAGVLVRQDFADTSFDEWQRHLAINLTAPFLLSQSLAPIMAAGGSIIHHGTIDAVLGNPTAAAYSVSKGGLIALTHVMAHTLGQRGIRVNCINSGAVMASDNGIPVRLTPQSRAGAPMSDNQRRLTPSGRAGTVEELARVALFLASSASSYVNGSVITVDGGRTGLTQGTF